jgi:hypothetical protein
MHTTSPTNLNIDFIILFTKNQWRGEIARSEKLHLIPTTVVLTSMYPDCPLHVTERKSFEGYQKMHVTMVKQ